MRSKVSSEQFEVSDQRPFIRQESSSVRKNERRRMRYSSSLRLRPRRGSLQPKACSVIRDYYVWL